MSVELWYMNNDGDFVLATDRVRIDTLELQLMAEEGAVGSSQIVIDDPEGTFYVRGLKPLYIIETEAVDDEFMGIIGVFHTWTRTVRRGPYRTGPGREVVITVQDSNTLMSRRIIRDSGEERPQETDVERIQWWASIHEAVGGWGDDPTPTIEDTDFLFTDSAVQMDETSYAIVYAEQTLNDAMQDSGKNGYIFNRPIEGQPIRYALWYGFTDREEFASVHRISNDLADVDPDTLTYFTENPVDLDYGSYTFAPSIDAELERDPSRIATGAVVRFDGDYAYEKNVQESYEFAFRDMVFDAELVKTLPQAIQRAQRYLRDLDEEDDAIEVSVLVPAALVNGFHQGHRIQVRFTNMGPEGYADDFIWMRAASRTVRQIFPNLYEIALDLRAESPPAPAPPPPPAPFVCEGGAYDATPSGTYPRLGSETTDANGVIFYHKPGHAPPEVPTPGYLGSWFFPVFDGTADFNCDAISKQRILVVGPGDMTILTVNEKRGGATLATTFNAELWKKVNGPGVPDTLLDTFVGTPGTPLEIEVPDDDAQDCIHYVEVYGNSGSMGVNGFVWVLADA